MYNTLTEQTLLYGSKNWTIKAKDKTTIPTAEIKFIRTTNHTLMCYKRHEDILNNYKQNLYWNKFLHIKQLDSTC
jgi:hypothetical protein